MEEHKNIPAYKRQGINLDKPIEKGNEKPRIGSKKSFLYEDID